MQQLRHSRMKRSGLIAACTVSAIVLADAAARHPPLIVSPTARVGS